MRFPFLDLGIVNGPYKAALEEAAARVIRSGRYVGGPEVEALERALAATCGTEHAVGTANGLDAIRLIFMAYIELGRLHPGDEVLVPANTYIASFLGISQAGLVPVPVEPDPATMNLDTSLLESHISPRTKAILTVHLYGRPCFDGLMMETARRHGLIIVEDNAQAIGATASEPSPRSTRTTGGLGDAAAISFYPTKNIGALGDAGAVTTSDKALADAVRALANYGSDRRYHNIYRGLNSRLDPIQAAMLAVKMQYLPQCIAERRAVAATYESCISNPLVTKPVPDEGCVWHQYVVRTPHRDRFVAYLAASGVGTDIHYATPPHLQPCYSSLPHGPLPVTETLASEIVSLPISSCTPVEDAREISRIINDFR